MWNNTRRGFNLFRGRNNARRNNLVKSKSFKALLLVLILFIASFTTVWYIKGIPREVENANSSIAGNDNLIDIYTEVANNDKNGPQNSIDNSAGKTNQEGDTTPTKKEFTFVMLGEMMMGGTDTSYVLPFREVSEIASNADYTVTSLTTNIVDLERIENPKSKYIVTKEILKAFTALGVDGVNVASDHMMDFNLNVFNQTKDILSKDEKDIIGLQDDIIYAEKDGIKVAFIGVCNEVIGSYINFTKAGIWMYDDYMTKIKAGIKKAHESADTVVLITHLGSENSHEITPVMSWFYRELVKAGADLVVGGHALGVYPLEIYKGTPIIYSLGYFMHDTDYEIGKKSGIFKFTVDVEGNISSLEITPTYIDKGEVKLYNEYSSKEAMDFMRYISKNSKEHGFEANIGNKNLVIKFK